MLAPKLQGASCRRSASNPADKGAGSRHRHRLSDRLHESTRKGDASIEIHADSPRWRARICARAEAKPCHLETRDAFGAAPLGEYDAIAVTGSLPVYDARFEQALRDRRPAVRVVGVAPVMEALLIRRVDDTEWVRESLFETVIEPLIGATAAQRFVF
jgi:protein-L-isoaspartate(D-aspartate) O-methyltransferase